MKKTVANKRAVSGTGREIAITAAEILDRPGGKRDLARRAVSPGKPDAINRESLCNDLNSSMYKAELYELAIALGLPVMKTTRKRELCELITDYYKQAVDIPYLADLEEADLEEVE